MPRFKVEGFGDEVKEAEAGSYAPYDGPLPPKNTMLRVKVKQLRLKVNKNNDYMLNCVVEVDMPKGHDSAKYNGCPAWWNGNITKESAGYVNAFLRSIAGSDVKGKKLINDFWDKGMNLVGDGKPSKDKAIPIGALGSMKVDNDNPPVGYILSKLKSKYKGAAGEKEMDIAEWVLPKSATQGPAVDADGDEIEEEIEEEDGDDFPDGDDNHDADEDDEPADSSEYSDEPPF